MSIGFCKNTSLFIVNSLDSKLISINLTISEISNFLLSGLFSSSNSSYNGCRLIFTANTSKSILVNSYTASKSSGSRLNFVNLIISVFLSLSKNTSSGMVDSGNCIGIIFYLTSFKSGYFLFSSGLRSFNLCFYSIFCKISKFIFVSLYTTSKSGSR
jgi:hypothetical protein